jgi:hypothetical protein
VVLGWEKKNKTGGRIKKKKQEGQTHEKKGKTYFLSRRIEKKKETGGRRRMKRGEEIPKDKNNPT